MKKFDIRKHYALIAAVFAVCCAIRFLYCNRGYFFTDSSIYSFAHTLDEFSQAIKYIGVENALYYYGGSISCYIAPIIGSLIMAIGLFLKNKKVLIVGAGVGVLLSILPFVRGLRALEAGYFFWDCFIPAVLYISLSVLIICALNGHKIVKRIWYIPAILAAVSSFLMIILNHTRYYYTELELIYNIIQIGMLTFTGLWLKETLSAPKVAKPKTAVGGADKLKMYKGLLDTGVITQQEYDEKRKEILGL